MSLAALLNLSRSSRSPMNRKEEIELVEASKGDGQILSWVGWDGDKAIAVHDRLSDCIPQAANG